MGMVLDLDLTKFDNQDDLEQGDKVPPGWYPARLTDHYEDQKNEGLYVFEYTLADACGAFGGKKMFQRINDPRSTDDPKKAATYMNRARALASRLGLVSTDALGRQTQAEFDQAIDSDVVVKIVNRPDRDDPNKVWNEIDYLGVYPPNHPDVPDDERKRWGLPAARPKTGAGAKAAAKPDNATVPSGTAAATTPSANGSAAKKDRFAGL